MNTVVMILGGLITLGKYIIGNAGAIATLVGAIVALYALKTWKREYTFKRNSELLEEAKVLFYQAEHAIAYLRNGFIFTNELQGFEFPSELEGGYSKERYRYTFTIQQRFDEKQHIFDKLYAIELRVRARFGNESISAFGRMKEKVKQLLLAAHEYSIQELTDERIAEIQKTIWKDCNRLSKEGDTFGDAIGKIVQEFDSLCTEKVQGAQRVQWTQMLRSRMIEPRNTA